MSIVRRAGRSGRFSCSVPHGDRKRLWGETPTLLECRLSYSFVLRRISTPAEDCMTRATAVTSWLP